MTAPSPLKRNDARMLDSLTRPVGFVIWQGNNFNYERSDSHLLPLINVSVGVGIKEKLVIYCMCAHMEH